jgi:hypothetical protein
MTPDIHLGPLEDLNLTFFFFPECLYQSSIDKA